MILLLICCKNIGGDVGMEVATISLYKLNLFLMKDIFNFVTLSQALNASCEIKISEPFPFIVRKKCEDPHNPDTDFAI